MVDYRDEPFTLEEIRQKLIHYYSKGISEIDRSMTITFILNNYGKAGTVFFSIIGSPPKGYGMYIPEIHQKYFYDARGKRWKHYGSAEIPEIDEIIKNRNYKSTDFIFGGSIEDYTKSFPGYIPFESLIQE